MFLSASPAKRPHGNYYKCAHVCLLSWANGAVGFPAYLRCGIFSAVRPFSAVLTCVWYENVSFMKIRTFKSCFRADIAGIHDFQHSALNLAGAEPAGLCCHAGACGE